MGQLLYGAQERILTLATVRSNGSGAFWLSAATGRGVTRAEEFAKQHHYPTVAMGAIPVAWQTEVAHTSSWAGAFAAAGALVGITTYQSLSPERACRPIRWLSEGLWGDSGNYSGPWSIVDFIRRSRRIADADEVPGGANVVFATGSVIRPIAFGGEGVIMKLYQRILKALGKAVATAAGPLGAPLVGLLEFYESGSSPQDTEKFMKLVDARSNGRQIDVSDVQAAFPDDQVNAPRAHAQLLVVVYSALSTADFRELEDSPERFERELVDVVRASSLIDKPAVIDGVSTLYSEKQLEAFLSKHSFRRDNISFAHGRGVAATGFVEQLERETSETILDMFTKLASECEGSHVFREMRDLFHEFVERSGAA